MIFHRAISTFFGSLIPSTSPIRLQSRMQCVSVTIAGLPKTSPMIRLALLRPTPGSFKSASKCRDVVIILFMKDSHTCTDVPGFASAKSTRPDDLLDLLRLCSRQRCHIRILRIKLLYNYVNSCICTLRCKTDTHKQFPCLIIIQCTACIRIFFFSAGRSLPVPVLSFVIIFCFSAVS